MYGEERVPYHTVTTCKPDFVSVIDHDELD